MILSTTTKKVLASLAAVSAVGSFGALSTFSAFTDTTSATGSSFAAGTVQITNDSAGSHLFSLSGLIPGTTTTRCINVANAGSVTFSDVALSGVVTGALAPALQTTVDVGSGATGGASSSCTGFSVAHAGLVSSTLDAFPTAGAPADDTSGWTAGASKSYRFTVTLAAGAANSMQGKTASLDLTWTASS